MQDKFKSKWYYLLAIVMLLLTFLDWDYGFYQILRWVVSGSAVYIAYQNYLQQRTQWVWMFAIIAILFNPISPIHLEREMWSFIDIIIAVIYLIAFNKDGNKA